MLDELISAYGNRFLVAALGVSLALLCLFIVLWVLRNRAPSPFVRGGRNRQPRLQVLDAAAIDTRRRIVLIRRDNVEHLVMIGGPTDLLIETGIGDERHYLTARALQAQSADDEARLAHQTATSLPAAQPVQTAASLAADSDLASSAVVIEREPAKVTPQISAPQSASARPAVDMPRPVEQKAEVTAPRSSAMLDRATDERPKTEPVAPVTARTPIAAPQSMPAATQAVAPAGAAPLPPTPAAAPAAVAAPVVATMAPITSAPARPPQPAALSTPSPVAPPEPTKDTQTGSASFVPELHAAPVSQVQMATSQEPAQEQTPPLSSVIVGETPTIDAEEQFQVEAVQPHEAAPELGSAMSPVLTPGPEYPLTAPSIDQAPPASFVPAPLVEVGPAPSMNVQGHVKEPQRQDAVPSVSPVIDAPSAEDVLEAARARVLSSPTNEGLSRPFDATRFAPGRQDGLTADGPSTESAVRDESPAPRDLSDFERVLEEEMALHIAADPGPKPQVVAAPPIPALLPETRSDRPRPPIGAMVAEPRQPTAPTGANPAQPAEEPNLQNEIARIFGEMSASRNS